MVTGFSQELIIAELIPQPENERVNQCTSPPQETRLREASDMHTYVLSVALLDLPAHSLG